MKVGIIGIGTYLPPTVRGNDWWPQEAVESWQRGEPSSGEKPPQLSESQQLILEAVIEAQSDPFRGSRERRILDAELPASFMAIEAAKAALDNAEIDPEEVELLLTYSSVPDYLTTNDACTVHEALGLPSRCLSLGVDAVCNSLLLQTELARNTILAGRARAALLVQCSALSRLCEPSAHFSPWLGDGASALVLAPSDTAILALAHESDGSMQNGLVSGIPGGRWYDEGRVVAYNQDNSSTRRMLFTTADKARAVVQRTLDDAGLTAEDIDFFACHQGVSWLRRVVQQACGLEHARSFDTFPITASLLAANIPMVMDYAMREGRLQSGDRVLAFSGGGGVTTSAMIFEWR